MSTPGALSSLATFNALNIAYEYAYRDNPFKKACITQAISHIPPNSRVLDVGCGTGIPVSEMLVDAGLEVIGFDIAPKMVELAQSRIAVKGKASFIVSDMLTFEIKPEDKFTGIFIIFSQLQLQYPEFHAACYKYASALEPGGLFVIGQMPSDRYVAADDPAYDEDKAYVEDYDTPFMGKPFATFMMSAQGQREFLWSMGLEIISETIDMFQPDNEKCAPEEQQYLIARRVDEKPLDLPKPLPRSMARSLQDRA